MRNDYYALMEQSECNKAFFSIIEPIIENGDSIACKHLFDSYEIKSMFEKVGLALRVIPLKSHTPIVVTNYSYVKEGAGLTSKVLTSWALSREPAWNVGPFLGGRGDPRPIDRRVQNGLQGHMVSRLCETTVLRDLPEANGSRISCGALKKR